jgi:O-antigen/teichoic acid export membrane protein
MKDISVSFVATALIQAANIATGMLAARLLLPDGRGELAAILLWPGLMAEIGVLGLSDALLYRAATRSADPRALFASVMTLAAGLTVILIAAAFVILPYTFAQYRPEVLRIALVYACAFLPINFAALFVATLFQGQLELGTWNGLRCLVAFGYLLFIGLALATGRADAGGFAAANILASLLAMGVGLLLLARRGWIGWQARIETMRGLLGYGIKVHVGEMLNVVRQRLDQALVALWLPSADLGLYVVALTVANGPMILGFTIANVAFPKISQQTTDAGKRVVFGRYFRFSLAVALLAALGVAAVSDWLVPLLFGRPFAPASPIVHIMLIGLVPLAAKLMFMQALKAWDRSLVIGRAEGFGLVVAAAALALLLPRYGIYGAAWSLVAASFAAAGAMAVSLQRQLDIGVVALLRPTQDDWRLVGQFLRRASQ